MTFTPEETMDERMEQIIDALEYRLAQLEDRVLKEANETEKEANETDRRSLRHRREVYYKIINKATAHA